MHAPECTHVHTHTHTHTHTTCKQNKHITQTYNMHTGSANTTVLVVILKIFSYACKKKHNCLEENLLHVNIEIFSKYFHLKFIIQKLLLM